MLTLPMWIERLWARQYWFGVTLCAVIELVVCHPRGTLSLPAKTATNFLLRLDLASHWCVNDIPLRPHCSCCGTEVRDHHDHLYLELYKGPSTRKRMPCPAFVTCETRDIRFLDDRVRVVCLSCNVIVFSVFFADPEIQDLHPALRNYRGTLETCIPIIGCFWYSSLWYDVIVVVCW
jgi:hypothetical protein